MPNQNIADVYKQSKLVYGPWVARSDVLDMLRANAFEDGAKKYRRNMTVPDHYIAWKRVHEYGKRYATAIRERDVATMIEMLAEDFNPIKYHAAQGSTTRTLRRKLFDLKNPDDTPLLSTCPCCSSVCLTSEMVEGYGDRRFCRECVTNGTARFSDVMGCYYNRYDGVRCYPDQESVEDCEPQYASADWLRDNGYRRVNGEYYADGVRNYSSSELERIFGYHDGPDLGHIPSEYDKRKPRVLLGMELELENATYDPEYEEAEIDRSDIARHVLRKLNGIVPGFVKAENDGSLDNGFELITGYTGLDVHEKVWKHLKDAKYFEHLKSHDTDTCGLHVHIDKAGMTALHAAKLATFIHSEDNRKLLTCIARRYNSGDGYARFDHDRDWMHTAAITAGRSHRDYRNYHGGKSEGFRVQGYLGSNFCSERYSALNFQNDHTVEFRMFRGTTKFETIMACLEFTFAAWHFSKQTSMSKLTTADFMEFICRAENRKDTKYLRKYLKAKKFRQFYQAERTAHPKFKDAEPTATAENAVLWDDPHVALAA